MAKNQNLRIQTQVLETDADAFLAIKAIDGYQPVNAAYSIAAVTGALEAMRAAEEAEFNAQNALSAARDAAIAAQWAYHNVILGVKEQVIAQFGSDSDQLASLGLKKKSERKAPVRTAKVAAA